MLDILLPHYPADHGKAEKMFDVQTKQPYTAHTNNPVPFLLLTQDKKLLTQPLTLTQLADIAPYILTIMGIAVLQEMAKR